MNGTERDFPIGEWVNLVGEDEPAVLAEVDMGADRIDEVISDVPKSEFRDVSYDGPHDLLWRGMGEYLIVPRSNWRERSLQTDTGRDGGDDGR